MLKAILFRVAAVLFGLTIFVVMMEIYLRVVHPEGVPVLIPDYVVGQRYRESFSQERTIAESGERVTLRFHSAGFRGPQRAPEKPQGVQRVVVHGDSEIAAIAMREEDSMVARLQEQLTERTSETWEVMNFGVSGFSTGQSLLAWRNFSRDYSPDIVVLSFFVTNDVSDNSRETSSRRRPYFYLRDGKLELEMAPRVSTGLARFLTLNLHFYTFQKGLAYGARHGVRERAGRVNRGLNSLNRDAGPAFERAWLLTGELIRQFRDEVEAAGSRFVLMIDPSPGQYDDRVWQDMLDVLPPERRESFDRDHAQRRLSELLADDAIDTLDLLPAFRAARESGPLSFGPTHWNVEGNHLAARELAAHIVGDSPRGKDTVSP